LETVKGFKDFLGKDAIKRSRIKNILVETFESFGFEPAETPIIEYENFVKENNQNDEVISDLFRLRDKGKRELALRYEFTFQLKRIIKNKKLPYKRYQIGEVFRDEPTSKNRFRQFTQCDVDIVGSDFRDEAEILKLCSEVMKRLDIDFKILLNSRELLNEALEELKIDKNKREKVLREIDKIKKIGEKKVKENLKSLGAEKIISFLKKDNPLLKKLKGYKKIVEIIDFCKLYDINISFEPYLTRGLAYYNGTVFEVVSPKMKESICGGGSYSIKNVKCTGLSFGLDRIALLSKEKIEITKSLIISLDEDKESIKLAQKLRNQGEIVSLYYGKPSKALEYANSYNFQKVIFIGKKEVRNNSFNIKDMKSGKESPSDFN